MTSTDSSLYAKIIKGTGHYLSTPEYLVGTLILYLAASVLTYVWLRVALGTWRGDAAKIAYEVATGGSPVNYKYVIQEPILWAWLVIFRVFTWLLVPLLIALALDVAFRIFEEGRRIEERKLEELIRGYGREELSLSGIALDNFVRRAMDGLSMRLRVRRRKLRNLLRIGRNGG